MSLSVLFIKTSPFCFDSLMLCLERLFAEELSIHICFLSLFLSLCQTKRKKNKDCLEILK